MCGTCDHDEFIRACDVALTDITDLPDRCNAAESWEEKVEGMRSWAEENEHVTDAMWSALEAISEGAAKWLDR
mgnify:CR=1 FL=1